MSDLLAAEDVHSRSMQRSQPGVMLMQRAAVQVNNAASLHVPYC